VGYDRPKLAEDRRVFEWRPGAIVPPGKPAFVRRPKRKAHGARELVAAVENHPDTTRDDARRALHVALRAGRVKKPKACERCGLKPERRHLHGHHADYAQPLSVEWLCVDCHHKEHVAT
jgi:hypothetical protein